MANMSSPRVRVTAAHPRNCDCSAAVEININETYFVDDPFTWLIFYLRFSEILTFQFCIQLMAWVLVFSMWPVNVQ